MESLQNSFMYSPQWPPAAWDPPKGGTAARPAGARPNSFPARKTLNSLGSAPACRAGNQAADGIAPAFVHDALPFSGFLTSSELFRRLMRFSIFARGTRISCPQPRQRSLKSIPTARPASRSCRRDAVFSFRGSRPQKCPYALPCKDPAGAGFDSCSACFRHGEENYAIVRRVPVRP